MLRLAIALLAGLFGSAAMSAEIFLVEQHPSSQRNAVLEDDGRVAYLYLTESSENAPHRHAVVYMRVAPVERLDWSKVEQSGEAPPIERRLASSRAVISKPKQREFKFRWSPDGNAVALLRNGEALAFVAASEDGGYSRAVAVESSIARPWSQARFTSLFPQ